MIGVYLSGPITRQTYKQAIGWRQRVGKRLRSTGFMVLDPLRGQKTLNTAVGISPAPYANPVLSDIAIKKRDYLDVMKCDIALVNLLDAVEASLGSCMEIAIADIMNKLIVLVIPEENKYHDHPLIRSAGVIFHDLDTAVEYIISCGSEE